MACNALSPFMWSCERPEKWSQVSLPAAPEDGEESKGTDRTPLDNPAPDLESISPKFQTRGVGEVEIGVGEVGLGAGQNSDQTLCVCLALYCEFQFNIRVTLLIF